MILNVKQLNKYVPDIHFKMEHLLDFFQMVSVNDKIVKLDLQDAFFVLPMVPEFRKYLQFSFNGSPY